MESLAAASAGHLDSAPFTGHDGPSFVDHALPDTPPDSGSPPSPPHAHHQTTPGGQPEMTSSPPVSYTGGFVHQLSPFYQPPTAFDRRAVGDFDPAEWLSVPPHSACDRYDYDVTLSCTPFDYAYVGFTQPPFPFPACAYETLLPGWPPPPPTATPTSSDGIRFAADTGRAHLPPASHTDSRNYVVDDFWTEVDDSELDQYLGGGNLDAEPVLGVQDVAGGGSKLGLHDDDYERDSALILKKSSDVAQRNADDDVGKMKSTMRRVNSFRCRTTSEAGPPPPPLTLLTPASSSGAVIDFDETGNASTSPLTFDFRLFSGADDDVITSPLQNSDDDDVNPDVAPTTVIDE